MQEQEGYVARTGLFSRWSARLTQAVMREQSVVLLERDGEDVSIPNRSVSQTPVENTN